MSNLKHDLEKLRIEVNEYLHQCLTNLDCPGILQEAMQYGVLGSGKRLRAILPITISRMFHGKDANVFPVAAALEMLHCYSLIHDDLPAMDNDDYRRGKLATHKKYGEAMGILVGDALISHAFWIIAAKTEDRELIPSLVATVAWEAGIGGMVSGQVMDIMGTKQSPTLELVHFIHSHKTAALIMAACKCGAIAAKVANHTVSEIEEFGKKIGLAFQIIDDILDICGTKEQIGKSVGKDEAQDKMTYPRIMGIDNSRTTANKLIEEAYQTIADIPDNEYLISLAQLVIHREA